MKHFSTFTLDTANECLWRGKTRVQLAPKPFAVLSYLIAHEDRLVTKEELLDAVWQNTYVQEAVLKVAVLEIRRALGENSKNEKHIVTVHRRGYRFVSAIEEERSNDASGQAAPGLLGRETDMALLRDMLRRATAGQRKIVFISGEPGIGKSALIEHFLSEAASTTPVRVLKGECTEHFGSSEAYYPVFQALSAAARADVIPNLVAVLRQYAPTWLADMPGFVCAADAEAMKRETMGASRDRMMREMSEAIEILAAEQPVVLVLEDLHWSDVSTVDLISSMANRSANARLLLICSYRPVDVILTNHPVKAVKQGLFMRGKSVELELQPLGKQHVRELFDVRFPNHEIPAAFVDLVHDRTDGNPLFVLNVVDYATSRSLIAHLDGKWRVNSVASDVDLSIPDSIARVIETQLERVTAEELAVLETASVVGCSFALSLLSGSQPGQADAIEDCCDGLARKNLFIRDAGLVELTPGNISARFEFTHALYRDFIYRRLSLARRVRLHRAIGELIEVTYAGRINDVASELALHFQECRDCERAIRYLRLVAQRCVSRHALPEALESLKRAQGLCERLGEAHRWDAEVGLMEQIGLLYRLMGQLEASAVEFEKMFQQASAVGSLEAQLRAQFWLASVTSWLDRERCLRAVDTSIALGNSQSDPEIRANVLGHAAYWNLLFRGWDERDERASAAALSAARKEQNRVFMALHANRHAFFLGLSSRYREACQTAQEGVRIAIEMESLVDYSVGHFFEAWALLHLGEWGRMQSRLHSSITLASKNGHDLWVLLFGLLEAFLHVQALDFEGARCLCREYLARARELRHQLSIQMALVLLGSAELGAGNLDAAELRFDELREWQKHDHILMDWIWKMPLQFGRTELFLARGDIAQARTEAELFLTLTSATAERTWTALAHHQRAAVAIAEKDDATAHAQIAQGLQTIEGFEAPLAAWRLHAMAAELSIGTQHRLQARSAILGLADSLSDHLKQIFLSSARVAKILDHAREMNA